MLVIFRKWGMVRIERPRTTGGSVRPTAGGLADGLGGAGRTFGKKPYLLVFPLTWYAGAANSRWSIYAKVTSPQRSRYGGPK